MPRSQRKLGLLKVTVHRVEDGAPVRRTVNRDKYANYSCSGGPGKFCIARKQQWVDTYVTEVVIDRLSQPDALEVYATDSSGLQETRQTLVALEAELSTLRAAKKDGRISLQAFLDFEPDLLTKIEDARARLLLTTAPPVWGARSRIWVVDQR